MIDIDIAEKHSISRVNESHCDWPARAYCECGWDGNPSDFTTHFMLTQGVQSKSILDWKSRFPMATVVNIQDYLDIFLPPNDVKARKSAATKARKAGYAETS